MPTFLEMGTNFDSSVVVEDNIIFQLKAMGKRWDVLVVLNDVLALCGLLLGWL